MFDLESEDIIGTSLHSETVRRFVETASVSELPVVLFGEPGVGKELVARRIHAGRSRREQPLLIVDCSLYYERELKRELFGYRGSGQNGKSRKGLFEFASNGTCYLSHVEELSPALQQSLLTFLREHRFRRLGDGKEVTSDARIIASSDKNLRGFVDGGLFDGTLYRELAALSLVLPPLRERAEDIPDVVRALRDGFRGPGGVEGPVFRPEVIEALSCFPWPGNYDELRREVLRLLESGQPQVTREHLSLEISSYWIGRRGDPEVRLVLEELEGYIREFRVLTRLDAEFGDVLLSASEWDLKITQPGRALGEHLF